MSDADLARAEKILPSSNWPSDVWANRRKALAKEFAAVRAEEREACARICDADVKEAEAFCDEHGHGYTCGCEWAATAQKIAAAIRAREGGA